jgi:hypothetical protein
MHSSVHEARGSRGNGPVAGVESTRALYAMGWGSDPRSRQGATVQGVRTARRAGPTPFASCLVPRCTIA